MIKLLTKEQGMFLLNLARRTINDFVHGQEIKKPKEYNKVFDQKRGVFCTLEKNGHLRGCIGLPYPEQGLIDAVIDAVKGAAHDPRFAPVQESELNQITIELSILTEPEEIKCKPPDFVNHITPNKDGLILKYGYNAGLFLPQVWKQLPEKQDFLNHLCLKAGLAPGMWKDKEARLFKFQAQIFKESDKK